MGVSTPTHSRRDLLRGAAAGLGAAAVGKVAAFPSVTSATPARLGSSRRSQTTKLVLWRHQYDPFDTYLQDIVFPQAREVLNLEFEYQVQRHADYEQTMLPQLATGGGPDIFEITEVFRLKFAQAGILAPVDYEPWGGREQWENYWETGVVDAVRVEGEDFVVPWEWGAFPGSLFVNGNIAEEAGIAGDIPEFQETPISWAELGPWAAKMTKRDANGNIVRDGFMIQHGYGPTRTYSFWEPYFLQAGGEIVSDDGKTSLLNTEPGIAAMRNLHDYVFEYEASMLRPQSQESGSAVLPRGETGSTTSMAPWAYDTFEQIAPETWQSIRALLSPQVDPANPQYWSGPGWNHAVLHSSPHKEAAFEFLHFLVEEHGADMFASSGIVMPKAGWTDAYDLNSLPDAPVWKKMAEEATPRVRSEAELLTQAQRENGFQRAFEAIMFSGNEIEPEMERWNREVQDALDDL